VKKPTDKLLKWWVRDNNRLLNEEKEEEYTEKQ